MMTYNQSAVNQFKNGSMLDVVKPSSTTNTAKKKSKPKAKAKSKSNVKFDGTYNPEALKEFNSNKTVTDRVNSPKPKLPPKAKPTSISPQGVGMDEKHKREIERKAKLGIDLVMPTFEKQQYYNSKKAKVSDTVKSAVKVGQQLNQTGKSMKAKRLSK